MADDYTPTAAVIRIAFEDWMNYLGKPRAQSRAEFDRWLEQYTAEKRSEWEAVQDTEEPEWEYGNEQLMHSHVEVFPASSEAVAKAQAWLYPVRRRRKAGPWEAVPAAENNEREEEKL